MYSALAMYMLRPPTSRGMPAFGWALSFRRVRGAILSMHSRIVCGPTEQLSPMTSAPHPSSACPTTSGVAPKRCAAVDPDGHLCDNWKRGRGQARRPDGLLHLVQIGERFEDDAVDTSADEP